MRRCFRLMIYEVFVGFRRPSFESIKSLGRNRFGPQQHHFWPLLSSESSHLRYFCDRCCLVFSTTFIWIDKKPRVVWNWTPQKHVCLALLSSESSLLRYLFAIVAFWCFRLSGVKRDPKVMLWKNIKKGSKRSTSVKSDPKEPKRVLKGSTKGTVFVTLAAFL